MILELIPSAGGPATKTIPMALSISGPLVFGSDGHSLYYPVTQRGVSNIVKQTLTDGKLSPVTKFNELTIYGYDFNWPHKKLAVARGPNTSDVVLIWQRETRQ
jgi:hypothetical protein